MRDHLSMRMEQLIVSQLPCNYVCHATYRPVRAPSLQLVAQLGFSFLNIGKDSPMDNARIGYRETVKNISRISQCDPANFRRSESGRKALQTVLCIKTSFRGGATGFSGDPAATVQREVPKEIRNGIGS